MRKLVLIIFAFFSAVSILPASSDVFNPVSGSLPENYGFRIKIIDKNYGTWWQSKLNKEKGSWLQVDLNKLVRMNSVFVHWGSAFATVYKVSVSSNAKEWIEVLSITTNSCSKVAIPFEEQTARYIKVDIKKSSNDKYVLVHEIEIGGEGAKAQLSEVLKKHRKEGAEANRKRREEFASGLKELGISKFVFAARRSTTKDGHWYANIGYYAWDDKDKLYEPRSQLSIVDVGTGEVKVLVDDHEGTIRDPVVHYDAQKILFSYRKGGTEQFHLYEINVDGTSLRQLTDGKYDDIEPIYLPDDNIMFVSTRCKRWVNCWCTQVAVIYRCDKDGENIRRLSPNVEHDNTPWVLHDGRIIYTRWEYIDRSQVDYHHLWAMNPDGSNHQVFFGNLHPPDLYIDAKPIPGSADVLFVNAPGHGRKDHEGFVSIVSPNNGPDDKSAMKRLTKKTYRDPYPLSDKHFIAARGAGIEVVSFDAPDQSGVLYSLPEELAKKGLNIHEPRPLVVRKREPLLVSRVDPKQETGKFLLANVYIGRNMKGVRPGSIKKLLIVESLPKPINFTGGMDPLTYGGSFTLERIIGTVPVEDDGSAYFELPANKSYFFIALDENEDSVKRMQSFTTVMPGETLSCIGCHEDRRETLSSLGQTAFPLASKRPPSRPEKIEGVPDVFDFPRDIQPILDKNCVSCHNPDKRSGRVILTGDRGPMFSHSYFMLTILKQFRDGRNMAKSNYPPYAIGASASVSPIMKKISGEHHGVKLSELEISMIRYWIESAAVYPGTYASLGCGSIGGYQQNKSIINNDNKWPESIEYGKTILKRCASCHKGNKRLPMRLSDNNGLSFWRPDWNDPRLKGARHIMFNLTRPEKSVILLAPLAKEAGGYAGTNAAHKVIFENTDDPGYKAMLGMMQAGKKRLDEVKRFDMPGFRPRKEYMREMIRYDVLPDDFDIDNDPIDVYLTDRKYWSLFDNPND